MGFFDKMKAANGLSLGAVESPCFPACKILVKNGVPVIISGALNGPDIEYPIYQKNIKIFKILGCGGDWVKYYILFKDGKNAVITSDVISEAKRKEIAQGKQKGAFGTGITAAPLERYLKLVDPQLNPCSGAVTIPMSEEQEIVEESEPPLEESYGEQEIEQDYSESEIEEESSEEEHELIEDEDDEEADGEHKISGLALGIILGAITLVIVIAIILLTSRK